MDAAPALTYDKAITELRSFFRNKPFIFMGTGMSCALDVRFGMHYLTVVLQENIKHYQLTAEQEKEWGNFSESLKAGVDLENSLNTVNDQGLLKVVTNITGNFLAEIDKQYSFQIAEGKSEWPAICIIKKLVETLSDNNCVLHVLSRA